MRTAGRAWMIGWALAALLLAAPAAAQRVEGDRAAAQGLYEAEVPVRTQSEADCDAPGAASTEQVLCFAAFGTALLLGGIVRAEGHSFAIPDLRTWLILLALAGIGHCLAWSLISRAMAKLPVTLVGLLLLLQPLIAFLLDVLVLRHDARPREWLGLGLALKCWSRP